MREDLNRTIEKYKNRKFESREFRTWIKDSNGWILIYDCLRVHGTEINKKELVEIINGNLRMDIDLDIYELILNLQYLYSQMLSAVEMQNTLDEKLLKRFASGVFPGEELRSSSLPVQNWKYLPPHFHYMDQVLTDGLRKKNRESDFFERAIASHMAVCESYVFGDNTPVIAMAAMLYEFLAEGLPLPEMPVDCEEYDRMMTDYLKNHGGQFGEMMERSLINRMDAILVLGAGVE